MLDAVIANGDRHHENWGVMQVYEPQPHRYLAPSYDHASSLGREISDAERIARLTGRDGRRTYLSRAAFTWAQIADVRLPLKASIV